MRCTVLLFVVSLFGASVASANPVAVGDLAPNFTAKNAAGDEVSLANFQGSPVVLTFSRAHW